MSKNFLKFKRKSRAVALLKSVLGGVAAGLFAAGLVLILSKLCVIDIDPIISLPIGAGLFILAVVVLYLILRKSDEALAKELDSRFRLSERVETMFAFKDDAGAMAELQREDAEKILGRLPLKKFKAKRLWIYFTVLAVSLLLLVAGIFVPDMRKEEKPEPVIPFELSEMQRVGLGRLIQYVEESEMEEPYKSRIKEDLSALLLKLEDIHTLPEMQAALAETMAYILKSTSDSSSMAEIANALWNTQDDRAKMIARLINTSEWTEDSDWGDFAEKLGELRDIYNHAGAEDEPEPDEESLVSELKWKIENTALKTENALSVSGISDSDAIYRAIYESFLYTNFGDGDNMLIGFKWLSDYITSDGLTYEASLTLLDRLFEAASTDIFDAINTKKINTNVGEYTMTRLSTLFLVPLPAFERPDFSKGGGSDSDGESEDDKKPGDSSNAGIGAGATYGSDDYVLDPSTGEYVKYGELLARYFAVMTAKLESGNYTDAQKEAITKYFDLLYSGLEKDEGK